MFLPSILSKKSTTKKCKYFDLIKIKIKIEDSLDTEFHSSKIYSKKIEMKACRFEGVPNTTHFVY